MAKKRIHKKRKPYSVIKPCEAWNFNTCMAEFAIPRLKMLRKNLHGYPACPEINSIEEWEIILDKIILGFELSLDLGSMHDKYFQYDKSGKLTKEAIELAEEDNKKVNEGLQLFAKWYQHLWD